MTNNHNQSKLSSLNIFKSDEAIKEGVPRFNIYLLKMMFLLMVVFLGKDVWTHILTHSGVWGAEDAMNWSVWASFTMLAVLGFLHPLKMLPIVMLEIVYKLLWLGMVAYPLWRSGQPMDASTEGMTNGFLWVVLPIVAMPWQYFFRKYILVKKSYHR